jgi:hypothetical protein
VRSLSLKDEKLPKHKIHKPRLFAPDDFLLFVLCRMYFGSVLIEVGQHGHHYGIMANLDPEQLAEQFSQYERWKIAAFDQVAQDASHDVESWIDLARIMLKTVWLQSNIGGDRFFHPSLPLLTRVNFIRCMLLQALWSSPYMYQDFVVQLFGTLASGCLLTFVLNCTSILKAFAKFKINMVEKLDDPDAQYWIQKHVKIAIFGDDNWLIAPKELTDPQYEICDTWCDTCFEFGYEMSRQSEGFVDLEKGLFCGRTYMRHDYLRQTMALEINRITKIVQFTKAKRMGEVFPGQVSTYIQEALRHPKKVYKQFVSHLRIGDQKLLKYAPWLKSYDEIHKKGFTTPEIDGRSYESKVRAATLAWLKSIEFPATENVELQMDVVEQGVEKPDDQASDDASLTTIMRVRS